MKRNPLLGIRPSDGGDRLPLVHDGGETTVADASRTAIWCFSLYAHLRASDRGPGSDPAWQRLAAFLDEVTAEPGDAPEDELLLGWAVVFRLLVEELRLVEIDPEFHRLVCAFVDCSILHASGVGGTGKAATEPVTSLLSQIVASLAAKRRAEASRRTAA